VAAEQIIVTGIIPDASLAASSFVETMEDSSHGKPIKKRLEIEALFFDFLQAT
jgi:hypothetical protein